MNDRHDSRDGKAVVRSGAIGASGGTALVVWANSLPDNSAWKPWLLLAAPSLSLAVAAIWAWLQVELLAFANERKFRWVVSSALKRLRERLASGTLTDAQRMQIEQYVSELELMAAAREYTKVKELELSMRRTNVSSRSKSSVMSKQN